MNLMDEAERYALSRGIRPTELLILDTSALLTYESFTMKANLLVLPFSEEQLHTSGSFLRDYLLDVLAVNLEVIVISHELPPTPEPFQNFRHKCILHISVHVQLGVEYLNTLTWLFNGKRRIHCISHFDQMIFYRVPAPLSYCPEATRTCPATAIAFRMELLTDISAVSLSATVRCNNTKIRAKFLATKRGHRSLCLALR